MKKFLKVLLVLLLVAVAAIGGIFGYYKFSKSPKAVVARTLKNLEKVESASFKMQVDAGVKAEVGLLKFLGIENTETTVSMDYDIDLFRDPSMMQCNLSINAFDIEALKDIEIIVANEGDETVRYYHWKDKWYRLPSDRDGTDESGADESAGDATGSGADGAAGAKANVAFVEVDPEVVAGAVLAGAEVRGAAGAAFAQKSESATNQDTGVEVVDFRTLLQGYESGEIKMEMREEPETVGEKECYVFDVDLTGDMFEKVIRFSGGGKGLIPKLKTSEHVTGQLYIDDKECLPVALKLTTGDILSEKLNFEQINAVLSVTKVDLDVDVEGYNTGKNGSIPTEYTDLTELEGMSVEEWINLALDLTGLGDVIEGEAS